MHRHGWLNFNKPEGFTSADLLNKLKRHLYNVFGSKIKIGHAGTLDQYACGVLPIALGEATKTVDYMMNHKKEYIFEVEWGAQTTTDDRDGDVMKQSDVRPTEQDILDMLPDFLGEIEQLPPLYSALKIEGKRASDRMRDGETVSLKPREIHIYELELLCHSERSKFRVSCSKGTYVRSLARDFGLKLNTYAHIAYLQRSKVGVFDIKDSIVIEDFMTMDKSGILDHVLSMKDALDDILALSFDSNIVSRLKFGQSVDYENNAGDCKTVLGLDSATGQEIGLIGWERDKLFPVRVFNIINKGIE